MPFHVERYLPGNDGGTLCLGITSTELASGGKDGVKIWNFHDWNPISIPPGGSGRGATTALVWIERNLLVYGTTTGCLVILRRRENDDTYFEEVSCTQLDSEDPSEIIGLVFDPTPNYLAACKKNGIVQLYELNFSEMTLMILFSKKTDNMPKVISFGKMRGDYHDVVVFAMNGNVYTFTGKDGQSDTEVKSTGCKIYNAYLNEDFFCIDDPQYGAKLLKIEDATRITEFPVLQTQHKVRMRGVVFYCDSENGKIIAIGSDHGVVYLNYLSGRVETLKVGEPDDRIQIVKVVDISGITTIIAACNSTRRSTIAVLKKGSQVSNFKLGQIVKIVLFLSILLMISVLVLKLELVAVKDPSCCGSKISESELWDRISEAERKIEMAMSGNKVVLK